MVEVYGKGICERSFREMELFVRHANSLGEKPMLFGGWAVYHYDQYSGSRDVDFVVSDENFDVLVDFLAAQGYSQKEVRLFKDGIFFDLYKRSEDIGSENKRIPFGLLYDGAQNAYLKGYAVRGGHGEVLVPSMPKLLFFKLHALAARSVPKDRSDVIALLLKTTQKELAELKDLLAPELKERLLTLRNDGQTLSLVVKPSKKNLNELNGKIKFLLAP